MMDFGFGAFLDKFEDHFGRVATKLLLIAIGIAIIAVCASIIITNVVDPLFELFDEYRQGYGITSTTIFRTVVASMVVALVVMLGINLSSALERQRHVTDARLMIQEYRMYREFVINFTHETAVFQRQLSQLMADFERATRTKERWRIARRAQKLVQDRQTAMSDEIESINKQMARRKKGQLVRNSYKFDPERGTGHSSLPRSSFAANNRILPIDQCANAHYVSVISKGETR